MNADDVERVAREIWNSRYAKDGGVWAYVETKDVWYAMARAALSAMPDRELLREALEELDVFSRKADDYDDVDVAFFGAVSISDLRRARAATNKIRAALTQEKQT